MVGGAAFGRMAKSLSLNIGGAVAPVESALAVVGAATVMGSLVRAARSNDKKGPKGPGM